MMKRNPVGVLLLAFGGPDSPESIEPFMTNLMGGRRPSPELLARVAEKYRLIGGKSPLLEITRAQAAALEKVMNAGSGGRHHLPRYRVYVAMRYWHPFIPDVLQEMAADGVGKAVAISLSPHYSQFTTGAYFAEVQAWLVRKGSAMEVAFARDWYHHPLFIQALGEKLAEGRDKFPTRRREGLPVVFSAHSLPVSYIREGDPYVEQLQATVHSLARQGNLVTWRLAYQSRGGGGGEWLGPQVEEVLESLAGDGHREVLLSPVGFVADHVETLYDVDIALRAHAQRLGLKLERCAALNTSPAFIAALAAIAREGLQEGFMAGPDGGRTGRG